MLCAVSGASSSEALPVAPGVVSGDRLRPREAGPISFGDTDYLTGEMDLCDGFRPRLWGKSHTKAVCPDNCLSVLSNLDCPEPFGPAPGGT